jgi:hypothetical protein
MLLIYRKFCMLSNVSHQRSGVIFNYGDNPINDEKKYTRIAKTPSDVYPHLTHQFVPKTLLAEQPISKVQRERLAQVFAAGYLNRKEAPVNNYAEHELHINNEGSVRIVQNEVVETPNSLRSQKGNPHPKVASIKAEETLHYQNLNEFIEGIQWKTKDLLEAQGQLHLLGSVPSTQFNKRMANMEAGVKKAEVPKTLLLPVQQAKPLPQEITPLQNVMHEETKGNKPFTPFGHVETLEHLSQLPFERRSSYKRMMNAQLQEQGVPSKVANQYMLALEVLVRNMKP